jgi:hypothetical protein
MSNTLLAASLLDDYPGGPFTPDVVDQAVDTLRDRAGWHIAPVLSETFTVEACGGRHLFLPTLQLVTVTAVRHFADYTNTSSTVTGFITKPTARFKAGQLTHAWGWPWWGVFEVDVTHGYSACPPELIPVIGQIALDISRGRAIGRVRQESVGSVSVSYDSNSSPLVSLPGKYVLTGV